MGDEADSEHPQSALRSGEEETAAAARVFAALVREVAYDGVEYLAPTERKRRARDDRFGGDEALRAEVEDLFEGVQWLGSFEADSQRLRWVELASASKKRAGNLGKCCWCGALFEQRLQGNPRRFCSQRCIGRHNYAEQSRLNAHAAGARKKAEAPR